MEIDVTIKKKLLETMIRIRFFEERTKSLFRQNYIFGALHLYIGQEAVAASVSECLEKDDLVLSTHRGHGHSIAKGAEFYRLFAELMGRKDGYSRGCGGSMHIFCEELGLLGGNGIVGGGIPISIGAGFSTKYRKSGQVVVCFFGDGASNQGTFHESINMAALWKLPIVFVCENNTYAATTRFEDVSATKDVARRGHAYGIKGIDLEGNDVEAIYSAAKKAVEHARKGLGPTLLECRTFRMEDHCMVIHQPKEPEEMEYWTELDPVGCYEKKLLDERTITSDELSTLRGAIQSEIDNAVKSAMQCDWPDFEQITEFV